MGVQVMYETKYISAAIKPPAAPKSKLTSAYKSSHTAAQKCKSNSGVGKVATIMSMIPIMSKTAWYACKKEEIKMQSIEINCEKEKN